MESPRADQTVSGGREDAGPLSSMSGGDVLRGDVVGGLSRLLYCF